MKRFFRITALALIAAFMIESDAQAAFAAGATDAEQTFEASDYAWTGGEEAEEEGAFNTESAEELESRYATASPGQAFVLRPYGVGLVSPTEVSIVEDNGALSVTNNKKDMDIYIAPVEQELASSTQTGRLTWISAFKVKSGETRLIYSGMYKSSDESGYEKKNLEKGKTYTIFAGVYSYMGIGQTEIENEDGSKELFWDEDVSIIKTITLGTEHDTSALPKDGAEIKFKAVSQKNGNVKLSWSPKKALKYKKYDLLQLNENNTANEWEPIFNQKAKKSYTDKKVTQVNPETNQKENVVQTAVYKLVCYDKDGASTEYIAVATPRLYYAETGYMQGYAEFCVSAYAESEELEYVTMTADSKKAYTDEGSTVAKTATDSVSVSFPIDYYVSTKVSVPAVRPYHESKTLVQGNNAVYRASTRYNYKGKVYESGLSNAISRKVGPEKCYVDMILGVKPDLYYKNIDSETGMYTVSGLQTVHYNSEGTCYKEGYVAFYGIAKHENVTRYELLGRKGTQYGSYKVLKKYNLSQVNTVSKDSNLYYVQYNNFPPEQDWYYAVRAVYGSKATGGFGDGYHNRTEFEQVQDMYALDNGTGSCAILWRRDKCAKEYWVYRAEGEIEFDRENGVFYEIKRPENPDEEVQRSEIADGLGRFSYAGKVKGSKTVKDLFDGNYVLFNDKKVKVGVEYTWIVRPVFNTAAKNRPLKAEMLGYLSDTGSASASVVLSQASTVKVSKHSVGELKVSWSTISKVDGYEIQWTANKNDLLPEGAGSDVIDKWDTTNWSYRKTIAKDKVTKGSDNKPSCVVGVEPGTKYYFRVRGYVGDPNDTDITKKTSWDVLSFGSIKKTSVRGGKKTANGKATPMAVKNLSVARRSVTEWGNYYQYGARVSWELNSNDRDWLKDNSATKEMGYEVTFTGKDGSAITRKGTLSNASGASIDDDEPLARGVTRTYNVRMYYKDGKIYGDSKSINYSKPRGLYITDQDGNEVTNITLAPDGSEYTFRVYAYTNADNKTKSQPTVRDLERCDPDDSDIVKVVNRSDQGAYTSVTVKAQKKGTTKFKVNAYNSSWTVGADGDNLQKTITVTVK